MLNVCGCLAHVMSRASRGGGAKDDRRPEHATLPANVCLASHDFSPATSNHACCSRRMAADDGEFQFDFSADEEQLLIQLATDAGAKDSVAGAIDALPARSDFGPDVLIENGFASTGAEESGVTGEAGTTATTLLLSADGQISSPICMFFFLLHSCALQVPVEN